MNVVEKYKGLTSAQVEENRAKYGRQGVAPPEREERKRACAASLFLLFSCVGGRHRLCS